MDPSIPSSACIPQDWFDALNPSPNPEPVNPNPDADQISTHSQIVLSGTVWNQVLPQEQCIPQTWPDADHNFDLPYITIQIYRGCKYGTKYSLERIPQTWPDALNPNPDADQVLTHLLT